MTRESSPVLQRDIRDTRLYAEAHRLLDKVRRTGTGQISDAAEIDVSPDGSQVLFTGFIADALDRPLVSRICHTDLESGETRLMTSGPCSDRMPKFSPDGTRIAFLSDRHRSGDFQLHFLAPGSGDVRPAPHVDGWVEYLHWSPDGKRILLGVAGHGADVAGAQGAIATLTGGDRDRPDWIPSVDSGDASHRWRQVWIYDLANGEIRKAGPPDQNIWEAVWCGVGAIAAIASPDPEEGHWYDAHLALLELGSGRWREILTPRDQLGWPSASPDGRHLAVVEAVCSDRCVVAGDLFVIETDDGWIRAIDTGGIDVTHVEWRCNRFVLIAGHRGLETVVALVDAATNSCTEIWASRDIGTSGRYAAVRGFGIDGDCVLVGEGFRRAPEIASIRSGHYRSVRSFDLGYANEVEAIEAIEAVQWQGRDGLELQGWLLRPQGAGPHPLVMNIHGGPILHTHAMWLGRSRQLPLCLLLQHGYAVFLPNPRGSSGRGQDFARQVVGAMGGADMEDLLDGIDHLVAAGTADPRRLGVTGVSYGGFMTCWLITQDPRFAAAVPIAPITNHATEHLLSNIAHFEKLFLKDDLTNLNGRYYGSSPLLHAHKAATPTLNICGAMDRCTPPAEADQFHRVLQANGVPSVLASYPEEGHGIHGLAASVDFAARMVDWFEHFMPANRHHPQIATNSPSR